MSQEFITYYRDSNRNPLGVVIALRDDNDVVQFGWASCNEGDTFDKEFGLDIARARAFKGKGRPVPTSISDVVRHYNFIEKCEKFFKEEGLSILIFRLDGEGRKRAYRVTSGGSQLLEIYPVGHLNRNPEISQGINDLIGEYAQRVVENEEMEVLMNVHKDLVVERLSRYTPAEIVGEIHDSCYSHLLDNYKEEALAALD
jgi:hypothetical protein